MKGIRLFTLSLLAVGASFLYPVHAAWDQYFTNDEGHAINNTTLHSLRYYFEPIDTKAKTARLAKVEKRREFNGRIDLRDTYIAANGGWTGTYTIIEIAPNAFDEIKADVKEFHCSISVMKDYGNNPSDNYATHLTKIGDGAFAGCSNLVSIELPTSLTELGTGVFAGCSSLTTIQVGESGSLKSTQRFPENITDIPANTFNGCSSLAEFHISENATIVGKSAFNNCISLPSISFGSAMRTIDESAFNGCTALSEVTLNDGLITIGANAFQNCTSITSIDFGSALTTIGDYAFNGCVNLSNAALNDGLTTIGAGAFQNCLALDHVVFPASLTAVGQNAYTGATGIKLFDARNVSNAAVFQGGAFADGTLTDNARMLVTFGTEQAYGTNEGTKDIVHLIADCPTQSIATILSDGAVGYHYRLGGDDMANYAGNTVINGTTYAYNQNTLTQLDGSVPEGLKAFAGINELSDKGYNYDRTTWIAIEDASMAGSVMGTGNTLQLKDKVNPTFAFESGFDINDSYQPITAFNVGGSAANTYAYNTYCPANFVEQSETWFVEPQPCEVATVTWAVYAGDDTFYVPAKVKTVNGWMNEGEENGGFTISRDLLNEATLPKGDFQEGLAYTFTGVIKKIESTGNAPRRADTFTPRTDGGASTTWVIAPVTVTREDNVVTGIDRVDTAAAIADVTYYNLAGQAATAPHSGVNIVVTRHTDGTLKTTKVVY